MVVQKPAEDRVRVPESVRKVIRHRLQEQLRARQRAGRDNDGVPFHAGSSRRVAIQDIDTVDPPTGSIPPETQRMSPEAQLEARLTLELCHDAFEAIECGTAAPKQP